MHAHSGVLLVAERDTAITNGLVCHWADSLEWLKQRRQAVDENLSNIKELHARGSSMCRQQILGFAALLMGTTGLAKGAATPEAAGAWAPQPPP
jgi:hypothetical protein